MRQCISEPLKLSTWNEVHWFQPWLETLWNEDFSSSSCKKFLCFGNPAGSSFLVGGYCLCLSEKNIGRNKSQIWMSITKTLFKCSFLEYQEWKGVTKKTGKFWTFQLWGVLFKLHLKTPCILLYRHKKGCKSYTSFGVF